MVVKRLLALIAAVAMIVGAVVWRQSRDDGDAGASGGDQPPSSTANGPGRNPADDGRRSIACVQEFAQACQGWAATIDDVDLTIEPYNATVTAFASDAAAYDMWITMAPLQRLAVTGGATPLAQAQPVAASPIVLAARPERAEALASVCGGAITWVCLGDNSDTSWAGAGGQATWGKVVAAHSDPTSNVVGLASLGAAGVGFFGNSTFNKTDIEADENFSGWFARLERPIPPAVTALASPIDSLLTRNQVSVAATTAADVNARSDDQRARLTVVAPSPTARVDVVAASREDVALSNAELAGLAAAFAELGWDPASSEPASMPSAGALSTLREIWRGL